MPAARISDLNEETLLRSTDALALVTASGNEKATVATINSEVNVKHYGALGDGVADDTTAIQNALTVALAGPKRLYFPAGQYKVAGTGDFVFKVTQPIEVYGDGWDSWIMPATGTPTTRDVFLYEPADTESVYFPLFRRLRIKGQSAGVCRYGIHLKPHNGAVAARRFGIEQIDFENLNSFAVFADGSLGGVPGIANGWLRDLRVKGNGFGGTSLGDSILIENCELGGAGFAVDVTSFISGAGKFTLRSNSVTASSGVRVGGPITSLVFQDNYFECLSTFTGSNASYVDLAGASGSVISSPYVHGNLFVVLPTFGDPNGLRMDFVDDAAVDGNRFIGVGSSVAMVITLNSNRVHVVNNKVSNFGARYLSSGNVPTGVNRVLCSLNSDSTAVVNTTTETIWDKNFTIPANYLIAGQALRIRASVKWSCTGTPTLINRIRLNGVAGTIAHSSVLTCSSGASNFTSVLDAILVFRTVGASANVSRSGNVTNNANADNFTISTAAGLAINPTIQWGTADPANTATLTQFIVELVDSVTLL